MEQIARPFAGVYNVSLHEGIVPLEWKLANIIPFIKNGSRKVSAKYRQVSSTTVICKILETISRDYGGHFQQIEKIIYR